MKVIIVLAVTCLALAEWTQQAPQAGANVNLDVSFKDLKDTIHDSIRHSKPGERIGFVRGLSEKLAVRAPPGYSYMVYNMNQGFDKQLFDVKFFDQVNQYEVNWGLWIFQCGTFKNKGDRGWQNWAYGGYFKNFDNGNGVTFTNRDCPNQAYRE